MLIFMMQTYRENIMTITAYRLSDTEVQVEHTVYTFSDHAVADAFQRCIGQDSIDSCSTDHAPTSSRTTSNGGQTDVAPGSVIAPSLGTG
jgi:hypothetical protein